MKKVLVVALSLTFLLQGSAFAEATKLPKKSCKAGAVKVDSKHRYICLKSGVWKKTLRNRVIIETKKQEIIELNVLESSSVILKTDLNPLPAEVKLSIDNLTAQSVFLKSRENIENIILKSSYKLDKLVFHVGEDISQEKFNIEKISLERAAKLWSTVYLPNENTHFVFFDFKSLPWAKLKIKEIHPLGIIRGESSCSIVYCGNATASLFSNNLAVVEQGLGGGLRNRSTSAHEYTHLVQASFNRQYWTLAPLWLVEGSAQFYGEAIGYAPFDFTNQTRSASHLRLSYDYFRESGKNLKDILKENNIENTKILMSSIEFPTPRYGNGSANLAYVLGAYATEVLVAVYGHESFEKFLGEFKRSQDWELNFKNSFGITKDEFYVKITKYLAEISEGL